jgi:RNA polymerase sigma-70 factor (ECF subfamily)
MKQGVDDIELMRGIAQRDVACLRELFSRFGAMMLATAARVVGDRHEAEDIVQDVVWEIWRRGEQYDSGRGAPRSYVLLLTRSRAIDRLRRSGRAPRALEQALQLDGQQPPPDAAVESNELRQLVRESLSQMSETHRRAIELSFFAGMSHQQIATHLDEPLGTVKGRIREALIRLKSALATGMGRRVRR